MAPLLATLLTQLATNGLNTLAAAVQVKGKEVIEEKLGIDLSESVKTPEGLLQLKQAEIDHQEFLLTNATENRKIDLSFVSLDTANTNSARDMNSKVQESANASWNAKNGAYVLDYIIVGATITLAILLFVVKIPLENKELALMLFGSLVTMCGTILNFHRGTSSTNRTKDETINRMATKDRQ